MTARRHGGRRNSEFGLLDEVLASAECFSASSRDNGHAEVRLVVKPGKDGFRLPICHLLEEELRVKRGRLTGCGGDGVHGIFAVDGKKEDVRCGI